MKIKRKKNYETSIALSFYFILCTKTTEKNEKEHIPLKTGKIDINAKTTQKMINKQLANGQ